jgi:hypothetical protein
MSVRKTAESTEAQDGVRQPEYPAFAMPFKVQPFISAETLLGLEVITTGMQNMRRMMDTARHLMRMQQDALIEIARVQCSGNYAARIPNPEAVNALQDAAQAYSRVGEAWLKAQRTALEMVAHPETHH